MIIIQLILMLLSFDENAGIVVDNNHSLFVSILHFLAFFHPFYHKISNNPLQKIHFCSSSETFCCNSCISLSILYTPRADLCIPMYICIIPMKIEADNI